MIDCVVCRYWSERLKETRTHRRGKSAIKQERRLMVVLRTHQVGACAIRFPDLLKDLAKQKPDQLNKAPGFCDPARARILVDSWRDELGAVPTYGWQ
jgi:hypothetical protein